MSIAEKLLSEFDEEFAGTRKFLELVPDDTLSWKPHEKSMELGRLASHLTDFPEWCRETLSKDRLQMTDEDGAKAMEAWKNQKRADMLAKFDRDLAEARALLAKASDADMARHWRMEWNGEVIIDSPKEQVLRKWVFSHMIHHRAQIGVYFRLNNIAIPGMYGPSADEMATTSAAG